MSWIRRFTVTILALFILTGCTLWPTAQQHETFATGATAPTVDFDGGAVDITPAETPSPNAALPTEFELVQHYNFTLRTGNIPESGVTIHFTLDEPIQDGQVATVARWLPDKEIWEPLETRVAENGIELTAVTHHFSQYGVVLTWYERIDLAQRLAVGNAARPPTCEDGSFNGVEPEWSEVQFFADQLSPTLWCVSGIDNEPDQLAVRLVWSRGSAARIDTAIEPLLVATDLFGTDTASQVISTLAHPELSIDESSTAYLVQPLGEYTFIFDREALNAYYEQHGSEPLIEVSTHMGYLVLGLVYDEIVSFAGPIPAAVLTLANSGSCVEAVSRQNVAEGLNTVIDCLTNVRKAQDILEQLANGGVFDIADPSALSGIAARGATRVASYLKFYQLYRVSHQLTSSLTDAMLGDVTRQLTYTPSDSEIIRLARVRQTEEFLSCTPEGDTVDYYRQYAPGECITLTPIDLEHPRYGPTTFVLGATEEDGMVRNTYWLLDESGQVIERRMGEQDRPWQLWAPQLDGSGNIIYTYYPGRSEGCVALRPSGEWFEGFGTDPLQMPDDEPDYATRFYGCTLVDEDNDGTFEILYEPSGGALYTPTPELYRWNGNDYEHAGERPSNDAQ